jgi:hypothetical protein
MQRTVIAILIAAAATAAAGSALASPSMTAPASAAAAKTPTITAEKGGGSDLSGKVVETMNAGGYTYVCLEKNGKKTWVAVPQMKVKVGSTMSFQPGAVMPNFSSPSLKRTFDTIVFSGGPVSAEPAGKPGSISPMPAGAQGMTGSEAQHIKKDTAIKVEKASGPNSHTIADVYAKRSSLDKKVVAVRGKVVKINTGIMGKNWVHIQDGTGDPKEGAHNLVATSQDEPAVGDVVTVTGTLARDRDFGGGYRYTAIIEDAKITK